MGSEAAWRDTRTEALPWNVGRDGGGDRVPPLGVDRTSRINAALADRTITLRRAMDPFLLLGIVVFCYFCGFYVGRNTV